MIWIPAFSFSQQKTDELTWHLTVADSSTNKGIDKVTVYINKIYYFTDTNGEVSIDRSTVHSKDYINISCIGYQSEKISIGPNHVFPDTIKLSTVVVALNEVEISPSGSMGITEGDLKKKYNVHRRTGVSNSYAQFIPNDKQILGTISSVEYVVNDGFHAIEKPFRIRLFEKMKDSLTLDKELTSDTIIVYNPQKKHRVSVDVSQYNIRLPREGVIAIFETLDSAYYSKDLISLEGSQYVKTPGIDMDQAKNNWQDDDTKTDRKTPYAMVGPAADKWNWDDAYTQWYVYADGNNFAITITVNPDK